MTDAGRGWVLDPIDGTKNFSRGVPVWATLDRADRARTSRWSGWPAHPRWAGGGGRRAARAPGPRRPVGRPRRITVSGVGELADAYLSTTDFQTFTRDRPPRRLPAAGRRVLGDPRVRRLLAVLPRRRGRARPGRGRRRRTRGTWPRSLPILAEAGGALTDLSGAATFTGGDGLASNGAVHDAALAIVGTVRGGTGALLRGPHPRPRLRPGHHRRRPRRDARLRPPVRPAAVPRRRGGRARRRSSARWRPRAGSPRRCGCAPTWTACSLAPPRSARRAARRSPGPPRCSPVTSCGRRWRCWRRAAPAAARTWAW